MDEKNRVIYELQTSLKAEAYRMGYCLRSVVDLRTPVVWEPRVLLRILHEAAGRVAEIYAMGLPMHSLVWG